MNSKGPVIIYHLGGGSEDFGGGGGHLIFRRKGGRSVLTESPKRGRSLKNFGRILEVRGGGDHSNLLGQCQTWEGGGITKVINSYDGGLLQCNNIKRGDRLNSPC